MAATATTLPDNPLIRQVSLMVGIAASVALGVAVVLWSQAPDYTPLYGSLAENDAAQVVEALQQQGARYKVDESTGLVMVPTDKLKELRMAMASQGLPGSSSLGFEMLQQDTGFGTSRLVEKARYHHAIEGELAKTIGTISSISAARVHLALPKQSVFVRKRQKPSASVTVKLYPGRKLEDAQVDAIVHLVASSIPEMETGRVTVVDQKGRLLSKDQTNREMKLSADQFEYTRKVEEHYQERIEDLLAPILGSDSVRAQVSADIDFTVTERTQERFNPDQPALRSEQINEQGSQFGGLARGVPGALSNQPPAAGEAPEVGGGEGGATVGGQAEGAPIAGTRNATRNYELDRVISHTRMSPASLRRLSVAVVVDDHTATGAEGQVTRRERTPEEIERISALVREAIGYNPQRGDSVRVINSSFMPPEPIEALPEPGILEQPWFWSLIKQVGGLILVILLIFVVLRPTLKRLTAAPSTEMVAASAAGGMVAAGGVGAAAEGEEAESLLVGADGEPVKLPGRGGYENVMDAARQMVNEDPKRVAQLVRTWIGEGG